MPKLRAEPTELPAAEYVDPASLIPWDRNPRLNDHAVEAVARSISRYGFGSPVVARLEDRMIISGHTRIKAAAKLGLDRVPCRFVDLSREQAERLAIEDNRAGEVADWDDDALRSLLADGFDLADLGWSEEDLEGLLGEGDASVGVDSGAKIDRAEELRGVWDVEHGQLWTLGSHRLLCGDATDALDVERLLGGARPMLMVTDPPYGVEYDPRWRDEAAASGKLAYAASRVGRVDNDDRVDWSDAYRLFRGDVAYTWSPGGDHIIKTGLAIESAGFAIRNQIIWSKPHFPISRGHYTYQHEPCWYAVRRGATAHWIGDDNESTVWRVPLDANADGGHSTQKPLELMARPIRNHDSPLVYEPFSGSGTTIIACEQLGRSCLAMEINPAYVAVAIQRWVDTTGGKPAASSAELQS